ncbi:unnamed protein product [Pleuronectes platessa]|uniref:Uncharacterized protein n=1 Tax=Pleuronectes platessa TaxID=8262 RepID=A0A9N7Z8Q3_PLEPL|nr:unnamed protein product [Pleuronectes platessa]
MSGRNSHKNSNKCPNSSHCIQISIIVCLRDPEDYTGRGYTPGRTCEVTGATSPPVLSLFYILPGRQAASLLSCIAEVPTAQRKMPTRAGKSWETPNEDEGSTEAPVQSEGGDPAPSTDIQAVLAAIASLQAELSQAKA